MQHIFIFGLGYSAKYIAKTLVEKGWRVSGTCRSQEKCESMHAHGITAHLFDSDIPLLHPDLLKDVTHILISIPPGTEGDPVLQHHLVDLKACEHLQWLGYFSTTGVYGNYNGDWVDETSELRPNNKRLNKRVETEQAWLDSGLPAHIFRLSGIYGPERSSIQALESGTAKRIQKDNQFFSRIHVKDIAQITIASIDNPNPGNIYNCADDYPCPQEEVVSYAATLLHVDPPELIPFEQAELSDMARSFYQNSRKVKNNKIKQMLGVSLHYPTYKEGLQQIVSEKK